MLTGDATVGMLISYFNFDPSRRLFAKNQHTNAFGGQDKKHEKYKFFFLIFLLIFFDFYDLCFPVFLCFDVFY